MSIALSAKAFILQDERLLLQYRDPDPAIHFPSHWGLFGGAIEPRETPEQGLARELREELAWRLPKGQYLFPWHPGDGSIVHIFFVLLDVPLSDLQLAEGAGMALVGLDEIASFKLAPEVSENLDEVIGRIA